MNIVVLTHSGRTITRPSTTLEKNGNNLFLPDFVTRISISPALIVNVSRPGRCIGRRFASRYADSITFGCLFYPENLIDGSPEGYACASCLDHTTHIGRKKLPIESAALHLEADGRTIFDCSGFDTEAIAAAIAEVSRFVFIRTGDIIAIELADRTEITAGPDRETAVKALINQETVLDFKLIL